MQNNMPILKQRSTVETLAGAVKTGSIFFMLFKILDGLAGIVQGILKNLARITRAGIIYFWNTSVRGNKNYKFSLNNSDAYKDPLEDIDWNNLNIDTGVEIMFQQIMKSYEDKGLPLPNSGEQMELREQLHNMLVFQKEKYSK